MTQAITYRRATAAALLAIAAAVWSLSALFLAKPAQAAGCPSGTLIKGSLSAVYYCGADGKRYVFTNDKAYMTWYGDFSGVQQVTDDELASITIGGNVTYRPGVKMLKIQSDPKTYVVSHGGTLRLVPDEACAASLYGQNWNTLIDDISDAFFVNYKIGTPLASCADFDPAGEQHASVSFNDDMSAVTENGGNVPKVTATVPATGATGVSVSTPVSATFNAAMAATSLNGATFTLTASGSATPIYGTVALSDHTAVFTPNVTLDPSTTYTATVTTGAQDADHHGLASNYTWTFTTAGSTGTGMTSVVSISPPDSGSNIAVSTPISLTFSGPMSNSTLKADSFTLTLGGVPVPGTVAVSGNTVTFTPAASLQPAATYTVTLTDAVRDANGMAVSGGHFSWSFTTAP